MTPTISCILPVYNGARYLAEAIESVATQDPAPVELIIVDDGSTDDSAAIAGRYAPWARVIRQENAGPAAARNRALALVSGEFIAFQDADDIWVPGKLTIQLRRFAERPELSLCFGHLQNFWEPALKEFAERVQDHMIAKPMVGHGPPVLLARRSAFDIVGPYDESLRLGEDTDWFVRAREHGLHWEVLPDVLLHRRRHGLNLTASWEATRTQNLEIFKRAVARRRAAGDKGSPTHQ